MLSPLLLGGLWLIVTLVVVTIVGLIARFRGPSSLVGLYVGLVIISTVSASKIIMLFGLAVPAGVLVYAASFLVTDILSECYGRKYAQTAVYSGLIAMFLFFVYSYITVIWEGAAYWSAQAAYQEIVGLSARVAIAGLVAFFVSQTWDIFVFHLLKRYHKGRHLWFRNLASTLGSQAIDTVIFITIAFYGVFPILGLILAQYVVKIIVAVFDTPFVYLAKKLLGYYDDANE